MIKKNLIEEKRCLVIAEIAQAHDGSLGMAHAFIDAVAEAGADIVKFQTHIAEKESTPGEPWRVKFSYQDNTRYEYWKRMEFSSGQWEGLANHARERGIIFLSSPFSIEAVDMLEELDVPYWKIGSGEIINKPLIERMLKTGKPLLLSTGMCTLEELDMCISWVKEAGNEFLVFQCTSQYPCQPEKIGLNLLTFYKERYECPVGLSDHSGTIYPGILAASIGAAMVEVHVTFSKKAFGPDVLSSLTIEELERLVEGIRFTEKIVNSPADKFILADEFADLRKTFYKSLVANTDIPAGTVIENWMLSCKKPGGGIPPYRLAEFVGRKASRNIYINQQIKEEDFIKN